eukprot:GSMAST32.ASY1.ANO1.971.1 assembled CDS
MKDITFIIFLGFFLFTDALKIAQRLRTKTGVKTSIEAGTKWRFGSNYVPQHYGNWRWKTDKNGSTNEGDSGHWNFGNDKRIECEACGYNMYFLVDRIGDNFNALTVQNEMDMMCDRVQWVFRSACQHFIKSPDRERIVEAVMRLTEPEDLCKQLQYCAPDFFDSQMAGGAPGMGLPGGSIIPGMTPNGSAIAQETPGLGFSGHGNGGYGIYPAPGSRPMNAKSPYSPYSFGGYDNFGFPNTLPGVPSSTPSPPIIPETKEGEGG